ncbi:MAG: hypothetical protein JW929_02400 [Anaerolineales bacterium]|nr:hypothetical protein [Anaerolineales bacterium]
MRVEKEILVELGPDEEKVDGEGFEAWWEDRSLPQKVGLGIVFAAGGIALVALIGLIVMLLWNWLMPEIFGLPTIDYWKAWGLMVLSWILFKGIRFGETSTARTERKRKQELRRYIREGQDEEASSKG